MVVASLGIMLINYLCKRAFRYYDDDSFYATLGIISDVDCTFPRLLVSLCDQVRVCKHMA